MHVRPGSGCGSLSHKRLTVCLIRSVVWILPNDHHSDLAKRRVGPSVDVASCPKFLLPFTFGWGDAMELTGRVYFARDAVIGTMDSFIPKELLQVYEVWLLNLVF